MPRQSSACKSAGQKVSGRRTTQKNAGIEIEIASRVASNTHRQLTLRRHHTLGGRKAEAAGTRETQGVCGSCVMRGLSLFINSRLSRFSSFLPGQTADLFFNDDHRTCFRQPTWPSGSAPLLMVRCCSCSPARWQLAVALELGGRTSR